MSFSLPLVIASTNRKKTGEIKELLAHFPVTVKSLADFGPLPPVTEDGDTFEENAYKKASQTAKNLGLPALADDSGLCVEALNGSPGVFSARFAGEDATDAERCAKLLQLMEGRENRKAAFECVISIAVPSGPALTYEGRCEGIITCAPEGENGFGYDPVFFFPPLSRTFAQLTPAEKGAVSHRGKALAELRDEFDKVLTWIRQHMPAPTCLGNSG